VEEGIVDIAIDSPVVVVDLPQEGLFWPYDGWAWNLYGPARIHQGIGVPSDGQARRRRIANACFLCV
jgi:hypothetical protein